jgi:regulator of replication initiation timing
MRSQTLEAEKIQNAQFLREINFKLDLLPALSQKFNAIPGFSDSIAALQVQMNNISTQVSSNAKTNEEIEKELENVRSDLVITYKRANKLEAEQKRTNLVIYNYAPQHLGEYTVKQEIMDLLNRAMPSLKISRGDVRDIFRLKSG